MTSKILDRLDVAVHGSLSVVTTLEFFEHHFAKVGLRRSLYDPTLSPHRHTADTEHAKAFAAWASFKLDLSHGMSVQFAKTGDPNLPRIAKLLAYDSAGAS